MHNRYYLLLPIVLFSIHAVCAQSLQRVGLYRVFETSVINNQPYTNRFNAVELKTLFTAPSGKQTSFFGFFDGDGQGGGNKENGHTWKIRFMPNETGQWIYQWLWSDGTTGGEGAFICDTMNAGKGVLQAYQKNPRWLAYNGKEPVWLKSYYESGHGSIAQPFNWISSNIYQPMIARGYNHLQVNWLLSLCCFTQVYNDGPAASTNNLTLYEEGNASGSMRLDVWKMMEQHVAWLNDRNIGLHMFLGFDGSRNDGPRWTSLSAEEKDFYVRYVVARLAPFANIAGWNFVWEVPGNRQESELGWAALVQKYDVFHHLRTYEDEHPADNEYQRPEYNFAAIENHSMFSTNRDEDRPHWKEPWTLHSACLAAYVAGKPVYMSEGNTLWRRYWQKRTKATLDDLRRSAWACATAGASFNWCGHAGEDSLVAFGPEGLPFFGPVNRYSIAAKELDILSDIMSKELRFYSMQPADSLLSGHDPKLVWCLAEHGAQYLVFATGDNAFKLQLAKGRYTHNAWINTKTGTAVKLPAMNAPGNKPSYFHPPTATTDWVLLIRKQ